MNLFASAFHDLLPLFSAVLLVVGLKLERTNYLIAAIWLSLVALILHYQSAGGEILGSYFGYQTSAVYTINLLILIVSLLNLLVKLPIFQSKTSRYAFGFFSASLVAGGLVLLTNLWINAFFIENKRPNTPIMQVATSASLPYCHYRYVFYKINLDGKISYMCPDHYGIFPSIGHLDVSPDFILNHLNQRKNKST